MELPAHLKTLVSKLEAQEAAFEAMGGTPMHKIYKQQEENMKNNPDHILHAFIGN